MADENLIRNIRVTKLSKATYNRWKIEIRDTLESHRIWKVVSGIIIKPEEVSNDSGLVVNRKDIKDWKRQ